MANVTLQKAVAQKKQRQRFNRPLTFKLPPPPTRLERDYYRELQPIINRMYGNVQQYLIPRVTAMFERKASRTDAEGDDVKAAMDIVFSQSYSEEEIAAIARRKGVQVSEVNRDIMERNLKRVAGIDIFVLDPFLRQELEIFTVNNVNLIKNLGNDMRRKLENKIQAGYRTGVRAEEMAKQINSVMNPRGGEISYRSKFIARDQISKLNGDLNQMRQTELGVEKYRWATSLDDRVRETHAENEGKEFYWSDPPPTGHPGHEPNCRCTAEGVLDSVLGI